MLFVTLDVFSGQPNPGWMLSVEEAAEFEELVVRERSSKLDPGRHALGYQGFLIRGLSRHGAGWGRDANVRVFGNRLLESFLLETSRRHIKEVLFEYVERFISSADEWLQRERARGDRNCPACTAIVAPQFRALPWNNPAFMSQNNCYNYANDLITN
jgi:hypothetical protein